MSKNNWPPNAKYQTYDPQAEGYGDHTAWQEAFHQRMNTGKEANQDASGVELGASFASCTTRKELTRLFKEQIKKLHPDLAGNTPENIAATQKLIAEYKQQQARLKNKS